MANNKMSTAVLLPYLLLLIFQIHLVYCSPLNTIDNEYLDSVLLNKRQIYDNNMAVPSMTSAEPDDFGSGFELNRPGLQKRAAYGFDARNPLYLNTYQGTNPNYANGYAQNPPPNAIYRRYIDPSAEGEDSQPESSNDEPSYSKKQSSEEAVDDEPGIVEMLLDGILGSNNEAEENEDSNSSNDRRNMPNSNENSSRQPNQWNPSSSSKSGLGERRNNMDTYPAASHRSSRRIPRNDLSLDNILKELVHAVFPKSIRATGRRGLSDDVYSTLFHAIDYVAAFVIDQFLE
ncbi:uncharacterized protein LOC123293654 isoform X1 [Chrysoperla carnea]|uniref:uncharacterized protein LOC123293654 isoform X1 n=1 Tax=Chrysoperla carnea TaxID=189513 RepID=UPI001D077448|nr:uncharacterized protein LOC123293654 isoform X1 [Chrysoperla carnea]